MSQQTEEHSTGADLAALSLGDLSDEDFRKQALQRLHVYMGAKCSTLWLKQAEGENGTHKSTSACRIAESAQHQKLLFNKEFQPAIRACVQRTMRPFQRYLVKPKASVGNGNKELRNPTDHWWFFQSATFQGQVLGVFGFALPPKTDPHEVVRRAPVLDQLGQYLYTHQVTRQKGGRAIAAAQLQKLLHYANGLVGQLDKQELSIYVVNQTRDIVGCERVSLFERRQGRWHALAVSGNYTVDQHSNLIKALRQIVEQPIGTQGNQQTTSRVFTSSEETTEPTTPQASPATPETGQIEDTAPDEDHSPESASSSTETSSMDHTAMEDLLGLTHTQSVFSKHLEEEETGMRFCLLFESRERSFFGKGETYEEEKKPSEKTDGQNLPQPLDGTGTQTRTLAEWTVETAKRALFASHSHQSLPMGRLLGKISRLFTEKEVHRTRRRMVYAGLALAIVLGLLLMPVDQKAIGLCRLLPIERDAVISEGTGRIVEVLVTEGDRVRKGELLGRFDTTKYETEMAISRQQRMQSETEMRQHQAKQAMTDYHIAKLAAEKARQQERRFEELIRRSQFRAPIDGVILTKDIHQVNGKVLQTGEVFSELAALDQWELQIEINEADYSLLTRALEEKGSLDVAYILSANSSLTLHTKITEISAVSQMAFASEDRNIFFVTISNIELPPELLDRIRPGFSGTARINIGKRPFILVTFRKFVHFLRMKWLI